MTERLRLIVFGLICVVFNYTNAGCTVTAPSNGLVDGKTSLTLADKTVVKFSCNNGFTLNGTLYILCRAGELNLAIPTCEGDCVAAAPTNGAVSSTTVVHGQTTKYSCTTSGYSLNGTATQTCTSGSLSAAAPTCEQDAECTVTAPSNGLVDNETSVTVPDDTIFYFTCNNGYTLNGHSYGFCKNGELFYWFFIPTCESVLVFSTNAPVNVSVKENTAVGTNVTGAITAFGDANLTYTLTSQIPDSSPKIFCVGASSGLLTVAKSPDYESNKLYTLNITVTSSQGTDNDTTDDTSAQHTITVYILDVEEESAASATASSLTITLLLLTVVSFM